MSSRWVQVYAFSLLFAALAQAQTSSGTVSGHVSDETGAAIAGAEVRLVNQATQDSRATQTQANGDFLFAQVQPGTFTLAVIAKGFKQYQKRDLQLVASGTLAVGDVRLELGAVTETVRVVAQGAPVQTDSAERAGLLDSRQIGNLMSRGRDVMALLQLLPGVVDDHTGSDTLGQFNTPTMDGARDFYNSLNIDGISGNTARGRTAEAPINMDAIAEVSVLANSYTAEYGTAAGGVINLVTKSGTRQFHGGAYYYNRNEAFNANNFFNNRNGIPRQRYRYNTEGSFLGGPIFWPNHFNRDKQKLFFFFSQEYLPNQQPNSTRYYTVPTAAERQGDFSHSLNTKGQLYVINDPTTGQPFPGNIIPASRMDPNSAKLLTVFPLPNITDPAITKYAYNFQIAGGEDLPVTQELLKVDYNISDRAKAWFRASGYASDNTGLTSAAIKNEWGPTPVDYAQTMPNLGGDFTYIFSPTLVNELTIGMNLWTEQQEVSADGLTKLQRTTYGIDIPQSYPDDNPLGLLPSMSFGGVSDAASVSYDGRFPMVDDSTMLSFNDGVSKVWNNHEFKFGVHYEHVLYNQYHQAGGANFPGNFDFRTNSSFPDDTGYAYANAFLGNYYSYTEATNRVDYAPVTQILEWYLQDHWRVTRRLTLDLGVRFTDALPQEPNNDNAGNFVPSQFDPSQAPALYTPVVLNGKNVTINPLTGQVVPSIYADRIVPNSGSTVNGVVTPTTSGFPSSMVYSDGILPAPRFGLAWDPFGDGKTAVHLGGGFFYNPREDAGTLGNLFFNPPAIYNPTQYYGTVATVAQGSGLLSPSSFSRDIELHPQTVTAYDATVGVQREIGWGTVVDVAYVGSFGRHLGEVVQLNEVPYGAEFLPQNQNPQNGKPLSDDYFRPYPGYGDIPMQIFDGNSSYHSLQITVNRRFARGIQFGVAYTHSKAMDYAEGDSTSTSGAPSGSSNTVATYIDRSIWNYGLASYDRPEILTFHFLYNVPSLSRFWPNRFSRAVFDGWQISDITSFSSGSPLHITMSTNPSVNFTGGGDGARPLMVGNPNLPSSQRSVDQWFNIGGFAEPTPINPASCTTSGCPPLTLANLGDMPWAAIRGPGLNNWDTSVFKNFSFKERVQFQLRAEAYNTFNHTQFNAVDTTIQYNAAGQNIRASAGSITSARDPRIMQFAFRVTF
jgi:Carboxypeptidase regulatory-like domain/TonB-dependent Receptor Plug Domain